MKVILHRFLLTQNMLFVVLLVQAINCYNIDSQESMSIDYGDTPEAEEKTEEGNQNRGLKHFLTRLKELGVSLEARNYHRLFLDPQFGKLRTLGLPRL